MSCRRWRVRVGSQRSSWRLRRERYWSSASSHWRSTDWTHPSWRRKPKNCTAWSTGWKEKSTTSRRDSSHSRSTYVCCTVYLVTRSASFKCNVNSPTVQCIPLPRHIESASQWRHLRLMWNNKNVKGSIHNMLQITCKFSQHFTGEYCTYFPNFVKKHPWIFLVILLTVKRRLEHYRSNGNVICELLWSNVVLCRVTIEQQLWWFCMSSGLIIDSWDPATVTLCQVSNKCTFIRCICLWALSRMCGDVESSVAVLRHRNCILFRRLCIRDVVRWKQTLTVADVCVCVCVCVVMCRWWS